MQIVLTWLIPRSPSLSTISLVPHAKPKVYVPIILYKKLLLEYSCNKYMYCDLIGHSEVSISHKDLQDFDKDLQV